jgi:hypothetical protein
MIAQNLSRDFVLSTAEQTIAAIDRVLANQAADVGGAPSPLDALDPDELEALRTWLRAALDEVDADAEQVKPQQVGDVPPPPKDDYVFMPRERRLGMVQTAFEEFVAASDDIAVETAAMPDDRRSGPEPIVTDTRLEGVELNLTGTGRRVWGKFEVTHPKLLSDPRWILSLVEKAKTFGRKAAFVDTPATVELGDRARVVLVGDWGSGLPRALAVRDHMKAWLDKTPEGWSRHAIHLGDVYYSGTKSEYHERFLDPWPTTAGDGSRSYALNGNHDMYSGGFSYFGDCLGKDPRFASQQGASYFRIANAHWQLLALDTSYDDQDLHGDQLEWLQKQLEGFAGHSILLSHHQLFSPYESTAPKLHEKVAPVLKQHPAAGWFWAHEHRCLVFRDHPLIAFASCVGHGGIPEYLVKELADPPAWFEYDYRKRHSTDWQPWNTFGFAVLDIDGEQATVRYVDEDGDPHYGPEPVIK